MAVYILSHWFLTKSWLWAIFHSCYRWGNRGSYKLSDMPKFSQPMSGGIEIWISSDCSWTWTWTWTWTRNHNDVQQLWQGLFLLGSAMLSLTVLCLVSPGSLPRLSRTRDTGIFSSVHSSVTSSVSDLEQVTQFFLSYSFNYKIAGTGSVVLNVWEL